jgi:hypothetical protein
MIELNSQNGADKLLRALQGEIMKEFPKDLLVGVEMGIAYGGGVEALGKLWKERGIVYGFDTFEGHPKQLGSSAEAHETTCMDEHYSNFGREGLSYDCQRAELNRQKLYNVRLMKGLITEGCCWMIERIHYCLLDLDFLVSMKLGYENVRSKIVLGGYLCLHDVVGHKILPDLHHWYENEVKKDKRWEVVFEGEKEDLAILGRVK